MKAQEIKFKNLNKNYSILIGSNILKILPNKIRLLCPRTKKIALIFDRKVPNKFKKSISKNLKKYELLNYNFEASEKTKSLRTVNFLLNKLLSKNFNRSDLVIAIGGGITGDLVGFVASIFKRGLNFISIPTTLLSQVDAAVGGKTGINSSHGKNLIGTFYQPSLVIADTALLKTLPRRDFLSGYSEVVKYGLLGDLNFFEWLEKKIDCFLNVDPTIINSAVRKACMAKCRIVVADEKERGERALLNLGHTFGHALESWTNYSDKLLHGEGVSIGCVLAFRYSKELGYCSYENVDRVIKHFKSAGLKTELTDIPSELPDAEEFIRLMLNDKKVKNGRLNLILARCIGKAFVSENVCVDRLRSFLVNELDYSS